ncbi:MAG: DNA topoisomerase IV subunit A [Pelagibacterales bacterium]|nr:DNA topoisomerase IV subunit A [Pelagibacterales bacterium]
MNSSKKNNQIIKDLVFSEVLSDRYLSYAMSTIVSRSLPDVRDGLKPVHRRLLFAMRELKMSPQSGFKKCARVVGDVIGKFHPHGDQAVYDAMVRLAQEFSVRYPLVDGQGNFGSIDGDRAAAMRYTEARLTEIAELLLKDIDKNTVDFVSTYDGEYDEPIVLPALFPNLLANGASGIAVGMATNIPSHNIIELLMAIRHLIKRPNASITSIMKYIKGPDFSTGGILIDDNDTITKAYETGRGSFRLRAKWFIEKKTHGQYVIVINEIPWSITKARIIEKIEEIISNKRISILSDIVDESSEDIRILIIPKNRDVNPDQLMSRLFKISDLELKINMNMNVIDSNKTPRVMNVKEVLLSFIDHRLEVVVRYSKNRLRIAVDRKEVLEGYLIVFDNLDEIIEIIREDDNPKETIMKKWNLTDMQSESILNLRLRFLRRLEEKIIINEKNELESEIKELKELIANKDKQLSKIDNETKEVLEYFKKNKSISDRRTLIEPLIEEEFDDIEEVIDEEPYIFVLSKNNWIQFIKGHENFKAIKYKDGDQEKFVKLVKNTDKLLLASNSGRIFTLSLSNIIINKGFGSPLRLFIDLPSEDSIEEINLFNKQQKMLVASSGYKGFIIPNMESLLAYTKLGKNVLDVSPGEKLVVFKPVNQEDDSIAIIGENHKLLIFKISEMALQNKGKGVILQKAKQGKLTDIQTFVFSEGITCKRENSTKIFNDLELWLGKRAQSGRLAPRGFPRSNRFS